MYHLERSIFGIVEILLTFCALNHPFQALSMLLELYNFLFVIIFNFILIENFRIASNLFNLRQNLCSHLVLALFLSFHFLSILGLYIALNFLFYIFNSFYLSILLRFSMFLISTRPRWQQTHNIWIQNEHLILIQSGLNVLLNEKLWSERMLYLSIQNCSCY